MDSEQIPTEKPHAVKRRLKSLRELDGRTSAAKAAFALRAAIVADLGGEDALSAMRLALVQNVAVLGAALENLAVAYLAGEAVDMGEFATLANAQRRLLADLGLDRKAVEVPQNLAAYLARRSEPQPVAEEADAQ